VKREIIQKTRWKRFEIVGGIAGGTAQIEIFLVLRRF